MSEIIIESNFIKDYKYFRIPGIISTDNNNLIIYYECRKESIDWAQIDIGMKKSSDGGLSWSERKIIVSGDGKPGMSFLKLPGMPVILTLQSVLRVKRHL